MNKYKLGFSLVGLTLSYLVTIDGITQPVSAESVKIGNIQSLSNSFSSKARDLAFDYQLAQTIQDLEKFCANYPYNSQCRDYQPSINTPETKSQPDNAPNSTSNKPVASKSGWAIVPEVSTLGLGGSVVRKIIPEFNARLGVNTFGVGLDLEDTNATYESDLNLFNVSTLVDYHPIKKSGLRLSGGLIFGDNNAEGTATPNDLDGVETIEIGGETFSVDELTSVDANFDINNNLSPYLGLGWGNPVSGDKGLGFWGNLGVVFGGSPQVNLSPNVAEGVPSEVQQEIDQAVAQETEDLQDELSFISIYPVLSFGVSYQF